MGLMASFVRVMSRTDAISTRVGKRQSEYPAKLVEARLAQ
jgi:hypothetical protein